MKYCDLHTHSVFSDGTWTPTEIIREAERIGLAAVALTDHNTTHGVPEFLAAAKNTSVEGIAGVEFSTDYGNIELHIVGLYIPLAYFDRVTQMVEGMKERKIQSNIRLAENLQKGGYDIRYEDIYDATPDGHVNRVHFAAELVKKGYVRSVEEAFNTLLAKGGGYYEEPKRLPVYETIAFLKEIGAVAILAHPFLNLTEQELREFLPRAKAAGLDGMETEYSTYDEETTEKAKRIAEEFALFQSGGSDFHGTNKPDISLGRGRGNLAVPEGFLDALKTCRTELPAPNAQQEKMASRK